MVAHSTLSADRLRTLAAWCVLLFFYLAALGHVGLVDPDEGRYTLIPREMLSSGDFLTPRLNGVLYFEKPPLFYWLAAASTRLLGAGPWGARLWSALLGFAGVVLIGSMVRSMSGRRAGRFAVWIVATTPLYLVMSRIATIDMTLAFFTTASLVSFWFARREGAPSTGWYLAFGAAALAVLSKGLVGALFPAGVVAVFIAVRGEWTLLRRVPWIGGIVLFVALVAPWHAAMALRHPGWARFYIVREHFLRYLTPDANRPGPVWYFAPILLVGFLPWLPTVIPAFALRRASRVAARGRERAEFVFLTVWATFIVLFYTASHSKLPSYVLPAAPPIAALLALILDRAVARGHHRLLAGLGLWTAILAAPLAWIAVVGYPAAKVAPQPTAAVWICTAVVSLAGAGAVWVAWRGRGERAVALAALAAGAFFAGLWAAAPAFLVGRNADAIADYLREHARPDEPIYCLGTCVYSLALGLGDTVDAVQYDGELDFGIKQLSPQERVRRFPTVDEFRPLWESERTVWLVADRKDPFIRSGAPLADGPPVLQRGSLLLLCNRPRTAP